MVRRALASVVLILAGCSGTGAPPRDPDPNGVPAAATFAKSFGNARNNSALVALPASDGGYVFVGGWGGWIDPDGRDHDPEEMWIGKLDANGDSEWQLLLGEGFESDEVGEAAVVTSQMHRTPDGGYVAAGSIKMRDTGHDFLIRKLNAAGSIEWSRSYDSGAWREYSYLAGSSSSFADDLHSIDAPAAQDRVVDLYPATGGGYWAVGRSVANVRTERESFDTGHAESIDDDYSSAGGNVFFGAESAVVLRLDEDGRLLGQHRYTEDQFDGVATHPIVRPAADGSALLVRSITSYDEDSPTADDDLILIDRVGANGQSFERLETASEFRSLDEALAVIQTDDPDGSGARDGVRDDGFAILWPHALLKASRDLEVEWGGHFDVSRSYHAVEQLCEPGASGPVCHLLVGGHESRPGGVPAFSRLEVLNDSGQAVSGRRLTTFQSIDALRMRGDRLQIFGAEQDHPGSGVRVETDAQLNQIEGTLQLFPRVEPNNVIGQGLTVTIYQDDGFAYSYLGGPRVPYSPSAVIERSLNFAPLFDTERPKGIVEVAPGSYIAVADVNWDSSATAVASKIWLVRITGGQIEWQRTVTPASNDAYSVRGVVPSGDGGVVLAVQTVSLTPPASPAEEMHSRAHRLVKIDGSGAVVWQTPALASLPGPFDTDRLAAVPGGYVALGAAGVLSRVDSAGNILWESALSGATENDEEPTPFESITAVDDGFALLAAGGRDTGSIRIVRTDANGAPVWSRGYSMQQQYFAIDLRQIIQTTDGGLLIAGAGIFENVVDAGGEVLGATPGQSNLAFIKLNRDGDLVWSRLYGGLMNESFGTVRPTSDGGVIVAAHSDSMGDRREAWILRLGPDGLIAPGCNADLGSFAGSRLAVVSVIAPTSTPITQASRESSLLPAFTETRVPLERPEVVTARQCLGTANSAEPLPLGEQVTLTIAQSGEEQGVVTSEPRGIACGTAAGSQFCSATFPAGTRVALRAEIEHFRSWGSACDEDSGGTSLDCVVVLDSDRTIEVEFGPPPPTPQFSLSFDVEGPGFINTDSGINCSEDTPVEGCSGRFNRDAPISVTARPDNDWRGSGESARFLGWGGDCESSDITTSLTLRLDRDLHCIGRFEPPNIELLTISVSGAGTVRDVPPGAFNCREGMVGGGCQARFFPGDGAVTLQAVPDFGQRFVEWGGDCASFGAAAVIDLNVSHNMTCTARFEQATAPAVLSVELSDPDGTATVESSPAGINCSTAPGSDCSEAFPPGSRVTLRATRIGVIWSGCDQVIDVSYCRVDVDTTPRSVRASFPPQ